MSSARFVLTTRLEIPSTYMRAAVRLFFLVAVLLLISPFVLSSLLVDQRGITIPGQVFSKKEYITVHYASWTRNTNITVMYKPPDGAGVTFLDAAISPAELDSLRVGGHVSLHYLLQKDLPQLPGLFTLRQMHLLPMVRLESQQTFSGLTELIGEHRLVFATVAMVILALVLWRVLRVPHFTLALIACVFLAVLIAMLAEFPRPMPAPRKDVRTATGTVKSIEHLTWLFRDNHQQELAADQPVEITGVQFVPEGRTEPVVAVDLIDDGSVSGLKEGGLVAIDYEAQSPRVAYIQGATRRFVVKNLQGIVKQGIFLLVVVIALLGGAFLFSRLMKWLVQRRVT